MQLYSYYRSSASYRARIAMNWKDLDYELIPVHLLRDGGQQRKADYKKINPMGHVPALAHNGFCIGESMAIFDYIEQLQPEPRLFPTAPQPRARVLQICELINSGIQPLMNLKVTQRLESEFHFTPEQRLQWSKDWVEKGLFSLEALLKNTAGTYCLGDAVTAADMFLVPQCFSARRVQVDVASYPIIARIEQALLGLEAFEKAHPKNQPDSE